MRSVESRIAEAITNSANYPQRVQPYILGADLTKLIKAVIKAVKEEA